jgi:hypothetical protein
MPGPKGRPSSGTTVLDVRGETGQAGGVGRPFKSVFGVLLLGAVACAKPTGPEQVADQFVDAYFGRADQEKAKEFTALGATAMLENEAKEVAGLRKEGYGPKEAGADVSFVRGPSTRREQRVRVPYEIVIHTGAEDVKRDADIELTEIQGSWKVVRVGLTPK